MSKEEPSISVIIPVYNCRDYIDNCLNSILSQSFKDFDVFLIDDFSTDGTFEYLYAKASEGRFNLLKNTSKGANLARQLGVEASKGMFIVFSDADDIWEPDSFKLMIGRVNQYNADLVIANINYIDLDGVKKDSYINLPILNRPVDLLEEHKFINNINPNAVAKLFSRKILKGLEFKNVDFSQDWNITYKAILNSNSVCFLDIPVYNYIKRTGSITNSDSTYKFTKLVASLESFNDILFYFDQRVDHINKKYITYEYSLLHIKFLYNYLGRAKSLPLAERKRFHAIVKKTYKKYHPVSIGLLLFIVGKSKKYMIMKLAILSRSFYERIVIRFIL